MNAPWKKIIVFVHQNKPDPEIDIYVDCIYQGMLHLKESFRKVAENEDDSLVEVVSLYYQRIQNNRCFKSSKPKYLSYEY